MDAFDSMEGTDQDLMTLLLTYYIACMTGTAEWLCLLANMA